MKDLWLKTYPDFVIQNSGRSESILKISGSRPPLLMKKSALPNYIYYYEINNRGN